jgi:hypothetical protein
MVSGSLNNTVIAENPRQLSAYVTQVIKIALAIQPYG